MNEVVLILAGAIAPFVVQGIKALVGGMEGKSAQWLAFGVALMLAVLFKGLAGELVVPSGDPVEIAVSLATQYSVVVGLATLIYRVFISGETRVVG